MNKSIEDLISNITIELKEENEYIKQNNKYEEKERCNLINTSYIIAILIQKSDVLEKILFKDITTNDYYINIDEHMYDDLAEIIIQFIDKNKEVDYWAGKYLPYRYKIDIIYNERNLGYCRCNKNDKDYNVLHNCCGHGCDWSAPTMNITYEKDIAGEEWDGDQSDYWKLEKGINKQWLEKNSIHEIEKKVNERKNLEEQIAQLQERIRLLDNE